MSRFKMIKSNVTIKITQSQSRSFSMTQEENNFEMSLQGKLKGL